MFHSHLAKRRINALQLDADWTPYTDAIPQGSIPLGIATISEFTGALIFNEAKQEYWLITPDYQHKGRTFNFHKLNARKVRAAIHQAQTTPTELET